MSDPSLPLPPPQPYAEPDGGSDEVPPEPPLPQEVLEVWGGNPKNLALAEDLISAWGLNRFINSELHTQARKELEANDRMAPIRKAFVEAQRKKEKMK